MSPSHRSRRSLRLGRAATPGRDGRRERRPRRRFAGVVSRILPIVAGAAFASSAGAAEQDWKTMSRWRAATSEEQLRVRVEYVAGTLTIRPGVAGTLYDAHLRFDADAHVARLEYDDERLRLGTTDKENASSDGRGEGRLDLELTTDVAVDLDVEFGAGAADLDLTGIPLRRLELRTGAGQPSVRVDRSNPAPMETASFRLGAADFRISGLGNLNAKRISVAAGVGAVTLGLDGSWDAEARLVVDLGVGALTLRVPESLGVRLRRAALLPLLASWSLDGMVKRDDAHYSANWGDASRRLDVEIKAGVGSLDVEWIR